MKIHLLKVLGLLLCLVLSACNALGPTQNEDDENKSYWSLAPAKGLKEGVVLTKGMTTVQVLELLGAPAQKHPVAGSSDQKVSWTYFRVIQSGRSMTSSQVTGGGSVTAYQPVMYDETLIITFIADTLTSVRSSRIRQYGNENNSPIPR